MIEIEFGATGFVPLRPCRRSPLAYQRKATAGAVPGLYPPEITAKRFLKESMNRLAAGGDK